MNTVLWSIFAILFAVWTPLTLLVMREAIRRRRSALLVDLLESLFKGKVNIPTLEFARNKYGAPASHTHVAEHGEKLAGFTRSHTLFVSAIPYLLLSMVGFLLLIEPICTLVTTNACTGNILVQALLWTEQAGDTPSISQTLLNTAAIAGAAFLGGYLFSLRALLRAVMNFELSPITWLRAVIHIFTGVIIALLLYRTLSDTAYLSNVLQITLGNPGTSPLHLWLAIAFIAGYVPDFGLATLVRQLHITYLKNVDDDVIKSVAIIPIEIVDGIDYDIRYRLEETNIADVQNLATYNPILLFVETPYGLYEAFDWVLQAQLCLAVGPKAFLDLKKYKVRTIIDLQQTVLGNGTTDALIRMIGSVLYADADPAVRRKIETTADAGADLDIATVKHAVQVMVNNLHTRRLLQVWTEIYDQLAPDAPAPRERPDPPRVVAAG